MTLDERVAQLRAKIGSLGAHYPQCAAIIRHALIEQDKITRHAAAEEVLTVPEHMEYDGLIDKDEAHARVMNCRGGTE